MKALCSFDEETFGATAALRCGARPVRADSSLRIPLYERVSPAFCIATVTASIGIRATGRTATSASSGVLSRPVRLGCGYSALVAR